MVASKERLVWCCKECGAKSRHWVGSCPVCKMWETMEEEREVEESTSRFGAPGQKKAARATPISEVRLGDAPRFSSGLGEVDRVLGGGVVHGSLMLLGGDPGIGKSTLTLQVAGKIAKGGRRVLYISGEESLEQVGARAKRLGLTETPMWILSETSFAEIKREIERIKPDFIILDSIQIVYKPEIASFPGSVSQVKEVALDCMHLAKQDQISMIMIGHVTKSGELAGPRVLEHIVDVVLEFEGDAKEGYRRLRSAKNRFGTTDELALFQMQEEGLTEVLNPSQFFLKERLAHLPGSAIVSTLEGTRPILIEIQSLVAPSAFATSSRKGTGIDPSRLGLLLAVLEKRVGYHFHALDVFVSIAGGLKVLEPAIDLGIVMAIASSFRNKAIDPETLVLGEVGLGGELRNVRRIEQRLKEALQMGFKRAVVPKKNLSALASKKTGLELIGFDLVEEAIDFLLGKN